MCGTRCRSVFMLSSDINGGNHPWRVRIQVFKINLKQYVVYLHLWEQLNTDGSCKDWTLLTYFRFPTCCSFYYQALSGPSLRLRDLSLSNTWKLQHVLLKRPGAAPPPLTWLSVWCPYEQHQMLWADVTSRFPRMGSGRTSVMSSTRVFPPPLARSAHVLRSIQPD